MFEFLKKAEAKMQQWVKLPGKIQDILVSFKEYQISSTIIEPIQNHIWGFIKGSYVNPRIAEYFINVNPVDSGLEPFTDFDTDPDTISQIKKVINTLYHAKLAFLDLERIDFKNSVEVAQNAPELYQKTMHHAYMANYLITHLDVNVKEIFAEELAIILPLITKIQVFSQGYSAQTKELAEKIQHYPLSSKAGEVCGVAVSQLQPKNGEPDFAFLTQFSAILPDYIDQFTQKINQYSSKIMDQAPNIQREKLEELRDAALNLLNNLEDLKSRSSFISLKYVNYIYIIRQIITLSMSSLEQMGHLGGSTQDLIRDKLSVLKYDLLTTLFGLVDKIEDNFMLKPGTLSSPLMDKIKSLYNALIYYAAKPVDFKAKGEELRSIEDSRFLSLRLELTYKRISEAHKLVIKVEQAKEAFDDFYDVLQNLPSPNIAVENLPAEIKTQLIKYYKVIQPYMMRLNPEVHDALIQSLHQGQPLMTHLWQFVLGSLPIDHPTYLIALKNPLKRLITKDENTHSFHIRLNQDLINTVHQNTDLVLFPHNDPENPFAIDESLFLKNTAIPHQTLNYALTQNDTILSNPQDLNCDQALSLYQWYRIKIDKFKNAHTEYQHFILLLKAHSTGPENHVKLNTMDDATKKRCRSSYNLFQPYFINGVPEKFKAAALKMDNYLAHLLSAKDSTDRASEANIFLELDEHFQQFFTQIDLKWQRRSKSYLRHAKIKHGLEQEAMDLVQDERTSKRAYYLIKNPDYSIAIKSFRLALFELTNQFNDAMRLEFTLKNSNPKELPYPELEDADAILTQCNQTLAIKSIFNCLYHIEGIATELEQLNDKSFETLYVYHLIKIYAYIHQIRQLSIGLAQDPHAHLLGRDLLSKAQNVFAVLQEHTDPYQVSHESMPHQEKVRNNALWYVLNAFYIVPKHIRTLRNDNFINPASLDALHEEAKKSNLAIEQIINNSHSYFKLFLQLPQMYTLYKSLTAKLNEFTSTAHDAVIDNLDNIQTAVFTPMLLEADLWEHKSGLKPGTLSHPMKKIIDQFFKGFIRSLELNSKNHIALVCDVRPLVKRQAVNALKINEAQHRLTQLNFSFQSIEPLYKLVCAYENFSNGLLPTTPQIMSNQHIQMVELYRKALPKLIKLEHKPAIMKHREDDKDDSLDALFNEGLHTYDIQLKGIKGLIKAVHFYYLGLKATHEMTLSTARETAFKFNELAQLQVLDHQAFVDQYTRESFERQMDIMCKRDLGLQYTDTEYSSSLSEFIKRCESPVVAASKSAHDIDLAISCALRDKIALYEEEHFAQYYHLDQVRKALAKFKEYISSPAENQSDFESKRTLDKKSERINKLIDIVSDKNRSIAERIQKIKDNTLRDPNFERIILSYERPDTLSFAFLKHCLLALLEALYLYTPPRKRLLDNISTAVKTEPTLCDLRKRFGLFAPQKPVLVVEQTEEEQEQEELFLHQAIPSA